ncbi:MAG: hypothetical protein WC450_11965, partial [Candidatus Omnitrophota bacterium]|jgi:hypothetical protein
MAGGIEVPDTYKQWWPGGEDIEALFAQLGTVDPVEFFTPDQKAPRTLTYPLDLMASEHEIAILYQYVSAKCQSLQATSLRSREPDELRLACYADDPHVAIFYRCPTNPGLLITLILYADGQIAANVWSGTESPLYELRRDAWEQIVARVRTVEFFVKSCN